MKPLHIIVAALTTLVLGGCEASDITDIGQGYDTYNLFAPWHGKTDNTRFCCHSTAEMFHFCFEVEDSTLFLADQFIDEKDVDPEDRVEIFFSSDESLKHGYFCAEIDANGHIMDYKAELYRKLDFSWNFKTMKASGAVTPWGYRVAGSVSRSELEELGIDLDKGFWLGVFRGDAAQGREIEWYSLIAPEVEQPDFHTPGVLFRCKASPKEEKHGVVVYPDDITSLGLEEWGKRIDLSGINLIGLHAATSNDPIDTLKSFILSNQGQEFLKLCEGKGVDVEYELHALEYLLPRDLFDTHPEYFRIDSDGKRCPDYNMCFSCDEAIEAMRPQIEDLLSWAKPTTHRYYFWTDDKQGKFCYCPECASLTPSEQALRYENSLLKLLREYDPKAQLAHLAYQQTLSAPAAIRADEGIFLEYAPIKRDYNFPLTEEQTSALGQNLMAFPCHSGHILEYWLDESMFSHWKKGCPVELPFKADQAERDIRQYREAGAADITCFATWLGGLYVSEFGATDQIFKGYGEAFQR